jgi:hypothetical protein
MKIFNQYKKMSLSLCKLSTNSTQFFFHHFIVISNVQQHEAQVNYIIFMLDLCGLVEQTNTKQKNLCLVVCIGDGIKFIDGKVFFTCI